ncbi:MAG: hypothetical protein Q8Q88_05020 [Phenylobacterium sp.]|uniref:hypothetical protein n=1 Tax=Phenylobacterium sp. TaxID=1871053 RepID=UPI0027343A0D|nr:hypothetical protein [Phenylobacterium sp.]MDP3746395.1 hypothetical protein [Phenylobacterium sp.]
MKTEVQPLWTWPVSLLLAGAVLLGAHLWAGLAYRDHVEQQLNLARLPATGGVVILGASKVRCGVLFDQEMAAALAARGQAVEVVRIARPAALFGDFAPAFEALEAIPPRLVLLEADYLALEPNPFRREGRPAALDWRNRARAGLRAIALGDAAFKDTDTHDYNQPSTGSLACVPRGTPRTLAEYAQDMSGRRTSTEGERRKVLARLLKLRELGADIALVDTPRAPAAAAAFPPRLDREMREVLRRGGEANHLAVLAPPSTLRAEHFLDTAHLNGPGRALYSAWLADQISARLAAAPRR